MTALSISDTMGDAVVRIFVSDCQGSGAGSGFAISDRLVVTNAHVVGYDSNPVLRTRTGSEVTGTVIGSNGLIDIAVIEAPPGSFDVHASWGDSSHVREGAELTVIGYPGSAAEGGADYDVTSVNVRSLVDDGSRIVVSNGPDFGSSGGPAFSDQGEVVGVVRGGYSTDNTQFAHLIPSSIASAVANDIAARPGKGLPPCPPPAPAPSTDRAPSSRGSTAVAGTWIAQISSMSIVATEDAILDTARSMLAVHPNLDYLFTLDWPNAFTRSDRIILFVGGFATTDAARAYCISKGLAVPDQCLPRQLT